MSYFKITYFFHVNFKVKKKKEIYSSRKSPLTTLGFAQDLSSVTQKHSALTGVQVSCYHWIVHLLSWPELTGTGKASFISTSQCLMQHSEPLSHGSGRSEKYIPCKMMHAIIEIP